MYFNITIINSVFLVDMLQLWPQYWLLVQCSDESWKQEGF